MKKLSTLFVVCFITLCLNAQVAVVDKSATEPINNTSLANVNTKISSAENLGIKETEYDFGKIPQGKPVIHIFDVENTGSDSLKIVNVQASCGCTTPDWNRNKTEAPGEKTTITVGYNAASEGVFNKTITITYNGNKSKIIVIKGEVWKTPATSAPENAALINLKD